MGPRRSSTSTHCGHGTTLKGLAAGVPLVCIPMGRDQNDTAARVVHSGAGLRLSQKASADQIRTAVERVLSDASYRQAAGRMAQAIASHEGCVNVIDRLEGLAR
jgi:UDP:flavonoid glycosyltransferase YjiC (YdhE family)